MSQTIQRVSAGAFPISQSVTVKASASLTFLSGALPDVADPNATPGTPASFGNTATQTVSVLRKLQKVLQAQDLDLGDIVQLRVFLVGAEELGGRLDFAGLQEGYTQFFGTAEQPNKPARTAVQVAALPLPGALVEIDAIAARQG
ncbi:MAG: RidA family protein [Pseudomonas sp.]|uniref:RidA family protein n=1 Tax=Pseudomonas abieticivorans TaxID=2931382 RepID=UPI0020BE8B6F|nr:RidA family protein [Pseudomonas sp. PIA16]MDE1169373.1 RidA family protein [Pseudomonas sp.]